VPLLIRKRHIERKPCTRYKGAVRLADDVEKGILRDLQDEYGVKIPALAGFNGEYVGQFIVGLPERDKLRSAEQDIFGLAMLGRDILDDLMGHPGGEGFV